MLLSECIDKYINKSKPYIKGTTLLRYEQKKSMLIRYFGNINIDVFTQDFLQDYINDLQKNGKSRNSIQTSMSLLLSSLKPYKQFGKFRYIATSADSKDKEVYSNDDIDKIEQYIILRNKKTYIPIMIAINTGMRLGEIMGLKWNCVDLENRTISVKQTIMKNGKQLFINEPKTSSGKREIPINDTLLAYLKKNECDEKEYYVITNSTKIKSNACVQRTNADLCKKLGIKPLGMHAYRHAFATRLLKSSQDFKAISQIMGHSNIVITQNIYNHPTDEQKQNVIACAFGDKEEPQQVNYEPQQVNYEPQFEMLQNQINELRAIILRLEQYVKDTTKIQVYNKSKPKYKVVSGYCKDKYFIDKKSLLEDLDITSQELKNHLNGDETILDDLGIYIEKL